MFLFDWLRQGVKQAILGGVSDAMQELHSVEQEGDITPYLGNVRLLIDEKKPPEPDKAHRKNKA